MDIQQLATGFLAIVTVYNLFRGHRLEHRIEDLETKLMLRKERRESWRVNNGNRKMSLKQNNVIMRTQNGKGR